MDTPLGSVLYITLGCAKNEVDTDRMRSLLTAAGYEEAFDPQDADIAIVNTCSFLASATSESIETTLELANEVQDGVRACPSSCAAVCRRAMAMTCLTSCLRSLPL